MATKATKEADSDSKESGGITFKCPFCGKAKPIGEMIVLGRFFPPIVACRDCEKKTR